MSRPLVIISLIVLTNFCAFNDSYKVGNVGISKTSIETYDEQDFEPKEEEKNRDKYSRDLKSTGRVIIGKWRNNGEALEPKWRDGDSVPLAPFSAISFESGWLKDSDITGRDIDSSDNYNTDSSLSSIMSTREKKQNLREEEEVAAAAAAAAAAVSSVVKNSPNDQRSMASERDDKERKIIRSRIRSNGYRNRDRKPIEDIYNSGKIITKNEDLESMENKSNLRILSSSYHRDPPTHAPTIHHRSNDNLQIKRFKYNEDNTRFDNYPMEYELFESEENDPKPRKRRPPENYESINIDDDNNDNINTKFDDSDKVSINETKKSQPHNFQLKTFLRMQTDAGLSLSEILQQKNLTLADLLKGKPNVIDILKSDHDHDNRSKNVANDKLGQNFTNLLTETNFSSRKNIAADKSPFKDQINNNNNNNNNDSKLSPVEITSNLTNFEKERKIMISMKINESSMTNNRSSLFERVNDDRSKMIETVNRHFDDDENEFEDSKEGSINPLKNNESLSSLEKNEDHDSAYIEKEGGKDEDEDDDEDEIMEFSDYPGKMSKFVSPVYETPIPIRNIFEDKYMQDSSDIGSKELSNNSNDRTKLSKNSLEIIGGTDNKNDEKIMNEIGDNKKVDTIERNEENRSEDILVEDRLEKQSKPEEISKDEDDEKMIDSIDDSDEEFLNDEANDDSKDEINHTSYDNDKNKKLRDIVIPKVDAESRAEILELFSSGSSAERLERLLASRNMSIEELIALRQRGSSQVHFAQVFESSKERSNPTDNTINRDRISNKENETTMSTTTTTKTTSEDTKKIEISNDFLSTKDTADRDDNDIIKTLKINEEYLPRELLDLFNHGGDNIARKINHSKYESTRIVESSNYEIEPTKFEVSKDVVVSSYDNVGNSMIVGNNVETDSNVSLSYHGSTETLKSPVKKELKKLLPIEIGHVEEILNNNDHISLSSGNGAGNNKYLEIDNGLSKVRPSIIASGGILGVTIVVFLSIFIACRIHQKKKFKYKNSLAKTVFNNPVMAVRKLSHSSGSVNSIMIDVVATSTVKRNDNRIENVYGDNCNDFESRCEIDNDSLNANDSWETIPDFMK